MKKPVVKVGKFLVKSKIKNFGKEKKVKVGPLFNPVRNGKIAYRLARIKFRNKFMK
ncbi:MAG: hypothetical protein Q4P25_03130 [Tissierellia bacterium]|nr:hypothetical protein [Tissierellia bacterium]